MTSGVFDSVLIESIVILRDTRQRRELESIPELADSINRLGLINPPVITRDMTLIAGERRLEACRSLGWTSIPVQWADSIDPLELHLLELEENTKRVDLSWQDRTAAVDSYHKLRTQLDPKWSMEQTAKSLGLSINTVHDSVSVARAINTGVKGVADADKFSLARNITRRTDERKKSSAIEAITQETAPDDSIQSRTFLINADFHTFKSETKFNFIHCDFPYGRNTGDTKGQSAAKITGTYADSPEIYRALLKRLAEADFIADSAHLMFWFAMDYYAETYLTLKTAGWRVNPYPLIWAKSDNAGILNDSNRGPRRVYETAFMASRGDRKIVRAVSNVYWGPTTREYHTSEKPKAMLRHFFRMFVDENTLMLDPTAGSGNSVYIAAELEAPMSLGLEINPEFYASAKDNLSLK